jgi:hypothetical protein
VAVALVAVLIGLLSYKPNFVSQEGALVGDSAPVVFEEALTSGADFDGKYCLVRYGDGGAIVSVRPKARLCLYQLDAGVRLAEKYRIELTVRFRQGSGPGAAGIGFAAADGFMVFAVNRSGEHWLGSQTAESALPLTGGRDASTRVGPGASNRLSIEVDGSTLKGLVNGKHVASARAPRDTSGGFGIFIADGGNEGVFGDLRVHDLRAGAPGSVPMMTGGSIFFESDLATEQPFLAAKSPFCDRKYADGGYSLEPVGADGCHTHPLVPDLPTKTRVEVSVRPLTSATGTMVGVKVGHKSMEQRSYCVWIAHGGTVGISSFHPDRSVVLAQATGTARSGAGASNRIAVEVMDRRIRAFVNNRIAVEAVVADDVKGTLGLFVVDTRAVFSNLRILDFTEEQTLVRAASGSESTGARDATGAVRRRPSETGR